MSQSPKGREKALTPPDRRARLPSVISRFLGYRPGPPPYAALPFPPFSWLHHVPLQVEIWLFSFIGSLGSILLIEAIMVTNTAFREVYNAPLAVVSFGASAILVFGAIESPLAQPMNLVLGQFVAALSGLVVTRLFAIRPGYAESTETPGFHVDPFMSGGLSTALCTTLQMMLGVTHPPGGGTALAAAVEIRVVELSWTLLPIVLASSLIMLGWALVINNVGRRRYPTHWYKAEGIFTFVPAMLKARREERVEARRRVREESGEAGAGGMAVPAGTVR